MVQKTKVILSEDEKRLISNCDWILTKRSVMVKVIELLNHILVEFKEVIEADRQHLPIELYQSSPKISKGENYLFLPYVILDYPKIFNKKDVFAVRTMFWWGNFFSCTLHISGRYKHHFERNILSHIINPKKNTGLFLCVSENEWQHHFEPNNYKAVTTLTTDEITSIFKKQPFIKVACKFSLKDWDNLHQSLPKKFKEIIQLIY